MGAVAELRSIGEARGQLFGVRLVAFSEDGTLAASGDIALELALWRDQKVVFRWDMGGDSYFRRSERIRAASFSADNRSLFVASGEQLWCLDTETGAMRWERRSRGIFAFMRNACLAVQALPGDAVLATYDDAKFEIRDGDGRQVARWGHRDCPRFMQLAGDSQSLVGADSFAASVFDLKTRAQTVRYVPGDRIVAFAASPSGSLAAIRTLESMIIWSPMDNRVIARTSAVFGLPCIDVSPTHDLVAVADMDGVLVYGADGQVLARADAKKMRVFCVKFMPAGSTLVAGCMDGALRAWDVGSLLSSGGAQPAS